MKKICIITNYYNSTNYGGILQAYALCKALNSLEGVEAEQISYDYDSHIVKKKKNIKLLLKRNVKRCLSLWIKKYGVSEDEEKKIAFKYFVDRHIPHTETLYKDGELIKIIDRYDCYVTGSDQVWNPVSMDDNFFLEFVSNKKKIAYASSLGADVIEPVLLEQICKKISSFHFVSVREKSAKSMLEMNGIKNVELMPDPVFLLRDRDWKTISIIPPCKKFLFVYFLSNNINIRKKALLFANKRGLQVYDFSPLFLFNDKEAINCSQMGPEAFIGHICCSDFCFTDSFHCTAFSIIFQKRFLVFEREPVENITSNTRIQTILEQMNLLERLVTESQEIDKLAEQQIGRCDEIIQQIRTAGYSYLERAVGYEKEKY